MKRWIMTLITIASILTTNPQGLIVKYKDGSYAVSDRYYDNDDIEYIQKNFSYSIC